MLILTVIVVLWIGRLLQTRVVDARTRTFDPAPVVQPQHGGAAYVPSTPADHAPAIALIQQIWGADWELGVAIAVCESGLQAEAVHTGNPDGSEDVGLFQINSIHGRSRDELRDAVANTRFAYSLFQAYGTAPWESSRPCWAG